MPLTTLQEFYEEVITTSGHVTAGYVPKKIVPGGLEHIEWELVWVDVGNETDPGWHALEVTIYDKTLTLKGIRAVARVPFRHWFHKPLNLKIPVGYENISMSLFGGITAADVINFRGCIKRIVEEKPKPRAWW